MKNKISIILVFTLLVFSCKKKEDPKPTNNGGTTTNLGASAKIDGTAWNADKSKMYEILGDLYNGVVFYVDTEDSSAEFNAISVNGTDTSMIIAFFDLPRGIDGIVGTYNLDFETENNALFIKKFFPTTFDNNALIALLTYTDGGTQTGAFKITSYNASTKKVSGEFNFTQKCSASANPQLPFITLTDGKFEDITAEVD